jgi:hypothetical protein
MQPSNQATQQPSNSATNQPKHEKGGSRRPFVHCLCLYVYWGIVTFAA